MGPVLYRALVFLVLREVISFLLLVMPTTFGTSELVHVACYSVYDHSACDPSEYGPSESHLMRLVFLDLVLPHWSFCTWS